MGGENPEHIQQTLDTLEQLLRQHGLSVNPKKTRIISNNPKSEVTVRVGGTDNQARHGGHAIASARLESQL